MPFEFTSLEIPDVILVRPKVVVDSRGSFMEVYKYSDFAARGIPERFVQDNLSHSTRRGILRGLHYQREPKAQGKLIIVMRGEIYDVAVDIRSGSPTYGRWVATTLAADPPAALFIPPGFAHGFCVLSDGADVLYKCTEEYAPELDRGIRWDDPDLAIPWPVRSPVLSPRDAGWPTLDEVDANFTYGRRAR